jgi:hypothetical protein
MESWETDTVLESSNLPVFQFSNHPYNELSDQPSIQLCPRTVSELFIEGTQPTQSDDWHWLFTLDTRNGLQAGPGCPPQFTTQKLYTLYPAEAQDWARGQGIPQPPETYSPLCPGGPTTDSGLQSADGRQSGSRADRRLEGWRDSIAGPTQFASPPTFQLSNPGVQSAPYTLHPTPYSLILTSPDQGGRYRLSSEIPVAMQKVTVAARPADGVSLREVTLFADGYPLATLPRPPYQILWPMTIGTHVFTALGVDTEGNELEGNSVVIEVVQ